MARRDYRIDPATGKKVPSVTEVMNHLGWKTNALCGYFYKRGKEGKAMYEHREKAAIAGNETHDIFSELLGGEAANMEASKREKHYPNAKRAADWVLDQGWEVVRTEVKMDPPDMPFAGTPDLIARNKANGMLGIVDLKTGFSGDEVVVQLAGYCALWEATRDASVGETEIKWGCALQAKPGEPLNPRFFTQDELVLGGRVFSGLLLIHSGRTALERFGTMR